MQCNCFDCPLGKKHCDKALQYYADDEELYYRDILYGLWCDKIGGKCGWYGFCDEAFAEDTVQTSVTNKKQSNKRTRRDDHIRRVNNIYNENKVWMSPYYEHDGRLIQSNFAWRNKRFYKKYSNKQVRKYNKDIGNGNNYRKVFDYHRRDL